MGDDQAAKLSKLEELLHRPDFVLEPNCMPTIIEYVKEGGTPQTVIEMLSDSYVGYAHMAALVCQWLGSFGDDAGASAEGEPYPGSPVASTLAGPSSGGSPADKSSVDEGHFLKEFVLSRFDPEKVADVFTGRHGRPPPWLEGLTNQPQGRSLVYALSALHRNCLLLNFAIQKILRQGHEGEVAVVGSSLASYFSVFHRLLAARLRSALAVMTRGSSPAEQQSPGGDATGGGSEGVASATLTGLVRELTDSCAHTAHTYLHAQQLLGALGKHPNGAAFIRLGQELELATASAHPIVWSTQRMLLPPACDPVLVEATTLVGRCLAALPACAPLPDVLRLAQLYSNNPGLSPTPLQHTALIQMLIAGVFLPGKPPPADLVNAAIDLLSYATTSPCNVPHSTNEEEMSDGGEGMGALLAALSACPNNQQDEDFNLGHTGLLDTTRQALRCVLSLGSRINRRLSPEDVSTAQQSVQVPVAAAALLHCLRMQLGSREYWTEHTASLQAAPGCLRLVLMVAAAHPQLLGKVVDMLLAALLAMGSQRADLANAFSAALVVIMRDLGAVAQVMAAVDSWAQQADPSLVRHAVLQVLSSVEPPYSVVFTQWLLRHMMTSGIRRKRDSAATHGTAELLKGFAATCLSMASAPASGGARTSPGPRLVLSAREESFLSELATK